MLGLTEGQTDRVEFVGPSGWAGRPKFSYNLYCNDDTSYLYVTMGFANLKHLTIYLLSIFG